MAGNRKNFCKSGHTASQSKLGILLLDKP